MTETTPTPTRSRKFLFALLAAALAVTLTLVLGEVLVRIFFRYNTPDTIRENSLGYKPSIFSRHTLEPSRRVEPDKAWGSGAEAEAGGRSFTVNEHGFRGRSFALEKPPGECRVVVLGGSAVFDVHAGEGRDWPHLVEGLLRESGHDNVHVVNGGVPGHASFDSLGRLYSHVWTLEPDFVLLYNAWNDLKYFRRLDREHPLSSLFEPYDEKADPFRSYRGSLDRFLAHSQLYVKLRNRYFLARTKLGAEGRIEDGELASGYDPLAVRQYELDVELVVDAARNVGAVPVLLTQATLVRAENSAEERSRIAYAYAGLDHAALARAFAEVNETVRRVARRKGADLVDPDAALSGRPELFRDHVHTSEAGSMALARIVAGHLERRLADVCPSAPASL